jgi:hypothetical protein
VQSMLEMSWSISSGALGTRARIEMGLNRRLWLSMFIELMVVTLIPKNCVP